VRLVNRAYGLGRSLWMYYGEPGRGRRLDAFYRPFVPAGGLCFDIGAHVGNRSRSWSRLGARVVAVEPQPDLVRFLRWLFRSDPRITLRAEAIAASPGTVTLHVSPRTPTVSTGSTSFIAEASAVPSFAWVRWSERVEVPATTLDALIAAHGSPDFVKIDVEGMEPEVLRGATRILLEDRPHVFAEAAHKPELDALVALLRPLGYEATGRVFNSTPTHEFAPITANTIGRRAYLGLLRIGRSGAGGVVKALVPARLRRAALRRLRR
jgi:FkbM family methyltransferase